MNLSKQRALRKKQSRLDARTIFINDIEWTVQLPLASKPQKLEEAKKSYEKSVKFMGGYTEDSIYRSDNSTAI